jgi:acyl-CoA thioester hydrolase
MKLLECSLDIKIRFSETDAMGVVWHGNYLKFFEDAREEFGTQFSIEYLQMHNEGFFAPIVKSEIAHKAPVYYGEKIRVKIQMIKSRSSKMVFNYQVINLNSNLIAAEGSTTQVFLDREERVLILNKPDFYQAWESKQDWITI